MTRITSALRSAGLVAGLGIGAWLFSGTSAAQGRFVEDIQISRSGGEAEIVIRLSCPMRFQADVPMDAGALLEVRVAPFEACRQLGAGGGIFSEIYRPIGGQLAHLIELEYESLGVGDSLLMLRFDRPVSYRVTQRADLRSLQLTIQLGEAPMITEELPSRQPPVVPTPATRPAPIEGRAPLTGRVIEPAIAGDYMLNLLSTREPVDPTIARDVAAPSPLNVYVSQTTVDGETWYRLRLGFFASEESARAALATLKDRFPRAWIGRAEPEEMRAAAESTFASGRGSDLRVVVADEPPPANSAPPTTALSDTRVAELLDEARNAMLDDDPATSIRIYSELLQAPGEHRASAREFRGLAYERAGQPAQARADYESYLAEFPGSEGSSRVRQRLNGLVMTAAAARAPLRSASASAENRWEMSTGVSQYYRRDLNQFDEDQAEITTLSALLSDIDFSMNRRGQRLDLSSRLTVNHMHDLLSEAERGPGDQQRISYAYVDIDSNIEDWSLRLGRQSLRNWGVLGRFDGAHFSYGWTADRDLHVMMGYPVESTRDSFESDRRFYGVAVEFDDLIGSWDVAAYLNTQTMEGIDARMAVGTELRYFDDRRSFTAMVDYDIDFGEINTALILATWQFDNRLTFSALFDSRKSPILTTRNSLIGQPVETITEMLLVWNQDEIRQLAVDRTAASETVTLGIAKPLAERFQINFDVTLTEIGSTIASGGVAAIPGTGVQTFYSTSLVGTGLFKSGDVSIINIRVGEADAFKTSQLTWDARFPIGRRIRINPRLRFALWEGLLDGRKRESVSPSLRFLMNMRNHYRLEFEVGDDRYTRTDSSGQHDASGSFINFGYRANF